MSRNLIETLVYRIDQMLNYRIKKASFNKTYSGIISDILFEPDTPRNSSLFGTYKIRFGTSEKIFRLDDNFVHEIGERVEVTVCENNPNHIIVKPVIQCIPPYKITYDSNEDKYIEYRRVKTKGKIYETTDEFKLTLTENDNNGQMKLPNSQTINFKGFDKL